MEKWVKSAARPDDDASVERGIRFIWELPREKAARAALGEYSDRRDAPAKSAEGRLIWLVHDHAGREPLYP